MKHAIGVQLNSIWPSLPAETRLYSLKSIAECMAQMMKLDFPMYGSIYFSGAVGLRKHTSHSINDKFCVGPHCLRSGPAMPERSDTPI